MQKAGVYSFTNINDGKRYIGQSRNIAKRKTDHLSMLRRGKHINRHFQRAFNRDGEGAFIFDVLCYCNESELNDVEQKFLDHLDGLYNTSPIAQANGSGKRNDEARENIRNGVLIARKNDPSIPKRQAESLKLRYQRDPELMNKLSSYQKGRVHSEEEKAKRRASVKAAKSTEEHRAKVSENSRKMWESQEYRERHRESMRIALGKQDFKKRNEAIKKTKAERFANPEYRAAISEKLKAAWVRRKQQST